MTVLGIETSCDETSAAVIRDGALCSNVAATQWVHQQYGGVVPELASRAHLRLIVPIVEQALAQAGMTKNDLNGISAVFGPGLIGSILVGLSFGKSLAQGLGIPFVGVNHMEAHIFSNLIDEPRPRYPFVNLTVSGGHTQLVLVRQPFEYAMLGETKDDAAGEAFDKVAKMLGIGYPGGPLVDKLAATGDPKAIAFPRTYLDEDAFDFSFSGIKTSVLYYLRRNGFDSAQADRHFVADVCASFQMAVIEVLVKKLMAAAQKFQVQDVAVAGGVSANSLLRRLAREEADRLGLRIFFPRPEFCTDNGAMVAMVGYHALRTGRTSAFELTAEPNLSLFQSAYAAGVQA